MQVTQESYITTTLPLVLLSGYPDGRSGSVYEVARGSVNHSGEGELAYPSRYSNTPEVELPISISLHVYQAMQTNRTGRLEKSLEDSLSGHPETNAREPSSYPSN